MAAQDGGSLAELFYKSMFLSDDPGILILRSMRALRDAVGSLGKMKSLLLEQWVNFIVHYGT